jgi:hypothetical protein
MNARRLWLVGTLRSCPFPPDPTKRGATRTPKPGELFAGFRF